MSEVYRYYCGECEVEFDFITKEQTEHWRAHQQARKLWAYEEGETVEGIEVVHFKEVLEPDDRPRRLKERFWSRWLMREWRN